MSTTVLVVEDDLEINELLGEYLALENMHYVKAVTGGEGIHLAGKGHPDAVILDLMLPDVDGFEVARTLTGARATYDIPVVILSCMCQDADKEKGYGCGALFYMNKPFLPDDLLATLRQALTWKANLARRVPEGDFWLGGTGPASGIQCAKSMQQMVADLFARTGLDDAEVRQIREAMEMLGGWVTGFKGVNGSGGNGSGGGAGGRLRVEYKISATQILWTLSEETPGLLADAFFKTAPKTGGKLGAGLMGWAGGKPAPAVPAPVPGQWMHLLTKVGAVRFERDAKGRTVRLVRELGQASPTVEAKDGVVPVVEVSSVSGGVEAGRSLTPML